MRFAKPRASRSRKALAILAAVLAMIASFCLVRSQPGLTPEGGDERMVFALMKPDIFQVGEEFVAVEFLSGPNGAVFDYTVACYQQDTVDCADVLGGEVVPIDSVGGALPRGYSRVLTNLTIPDNTDVDCFVTVGGGPLDLVSKCQLAGEATTDPLPVPTGYSISVSNAVEDPLTDPTQELLVKVEEDVGRIALLESIFAEDGSASRNYDVTFEVQCLEDPAAACDLSGPWTDGVSLFVTGTLITGLTPNTDYQCFVKASYNDATGAAVTKCSTADMAAVVPTLPGPPTCLGISNPTRESLDVDALLPFPDNGDAVTVQGYAFQCLDSSEAACDPDGPWFPSSTPFASDPTTPVTVSGLAAATDYNCWAATVVGDSAPFTYYCSDPGEAGTLPFYPPSVTAASGDVGSQVAVTGTAASPPNGGTNLKVACVAQGDDCPDVLALGWVAVGTSGTAEQVAKLSDGSADLVGGTTYTCYSIEVDANDSSINKCSGPVDVIAALNVPTVSAVTGLIGGAVTVTATAAAPSNQDTELKIACVADGGTCPTATGTTWNTVPTSGSLQEVQTLADGSSMVAGTAYTCYSAEISTTDSNYRVCSLKSDVTAKTLNAPSVTAASGSVPNQVAVTGTAPTDDNVGTSLKVACVVQGGDCPDLLAPGWVVVGNSGTAEQVAKLSDGLTDLAAGTTYTCWSAEFDATSRVCSATGFDATPPLFYKAGNDVTILCPDAAVGDTGDVDLITYTKRDRTDLINLITSATGQAQLDDDLAKTCTSGVVDLSFLFVTGDGNYTPRNGFIGQMNPDVSSWDTSSVTLMESTFDGLTSFDRPVGDWDTSSVTTMLGMFFACENFNQPLVAWDTTSVTDMAYMFGNAYKFDQPIGNWETGLVTTMQAMFASDPSAGGTSSTIFNQDITGWDTGSVQVMAGMFLNNNQFNQPIGSWSTSSVLDMDTMFFGATSFDQPLSLWDGSLNSVQLMAGMFNGATAFNQDLSGWIVPNVVSCAGFSTGSGMTSGSPPNPNFPACNPA